jgi:hypothetical protein
MVAACRQEALFRAFFCTLIHLEGVSVKPLQKIREKLQIPKKAAPPTEGEN